MMCLAAKYLMRITAALSFPAGSILREDWNGSGIDAYQVTSCLCSSSQIEETRGSPAAKSSEEVGLAAEDSGTLCFFGYRELWILLSKRRMEISARYDVDCIESRFSQLGRWVWSIKS